LEPFEEPDGRLAREVARRYWTMAGRCSGLPECCIAWFVVVQELEAFVGPWSPWSWHENLQRRPWSAAGPDRPRPDYVPCPWCRATRTFVKVRPCPNDPHFCDCDFVKLEALFMPRIARVGFLALMERAPWWRALETQKKEE